MAAFAKGQYVELYPTIPSERGSIPGGTRGVVQEIDTSRADAAIYRVAFLNSEQLSDQQAWLREIDLLPA